MFFFQGKIAFAPGAGSRDELFGGGEAVDPAVSTFFIQRYCASK